MQSDRPIRRALIVTVGQTSAPIELAITQHEPDGVVFVASQQSHTVAAEMIGSFAGEFRHHTLLLADAEDLQESYQKGVAALERALAWEAQAITADLTGGTKPMVAGVALTGRGVTFSYVGGETRDEYGRVRSGHERVRVLEDPSTRFHLLEWERFTSAWNGWRFTEAGDQLAAILARPLSRSERRFFEHLHGVVAALDAWDTFHHAQALAGLEAHLESAIAIAEAWRHGAKVRVLLALLEALEPLRKLVEAGAKPSYALLGDLLANAQRRADTGRFDDALARLYRAVELAAEVDICTRHGIVIKDPATMTALSPELREKAKGVLGLREVLNLAYDIDLFFGKRGTLAQQLAGEYDTALQPLLQRRHESILAHGLTPVGPEAYEALLNYLLDKSLHPAQAWPRW